MPEARSYSPFEVESPTEWLGRIFVLKLAGQAFYVGPHWYFSLLMLGFIVSVGCFHCSSVYSSDDLQLSGGIAVTLLTTVAFLRCALSDPGVLILGSGALPSLHGFEEPSKSRTNGSSSMSKLITCRFLTFFKDVLGSGRLVTVRLDAQEEHWRG